MRVSQVQTGESCIIRGQLRNGGLGTMHNNSRRAAVVPHGPYLNASKPSDQSIGLDGIIGYSSAIGQILIVYLVYILKRQS